eukprot:scaffold27226_cov64-Isochrysis_galbana.AAC.1
MDGSNARAYNNRGALFLTEARHADALADFEQAGVKMGVTTERAAGTAGRNSLRRCSVRKRGLGAVAFSPHLKLVFTPLTPGLLTPSARVWARCKWHPAEGHVTHPPGATRRYSDGS